MHGLPSKVFSALKRFFPLARNLRLGVAVSGGPDSVALLGALVELASREALHLTVLHVNHALRPEADQEQQLVEDLCRRWQLPCVVKALTPPRARKGIEVWARVERYQFFQQAKDQHRLDAVALAHTRDDQAETVLFRLLRGAGRRGLTGMPARRNGWIIRPLLSCSRQEVLSYISTTQLPYATDDSNTDLRYTRNKIRHMLLPLLEREFSPQIRQHLVHTAESLRQEEAWLEEQAQAAYERVRAREDRLFKSRLLAEPQALRPRIFRIWLEQNQKQKPRELSFLHFQRLAALVEGRIAGQVELPGALVVSREGEFLVLVEKRPCSVIHVYRYDLVYGASLKIPETGWEIDASCPVAWNGTPFEARLRDPWLAVCDVDALAEPLMVRSYEPGDRMRPLGMQGQKKLHDIFIDKKIGVAQRRLWPLVLCGAEIIWVPGCVRGERGKVTAATQRVCWLRVNPLPENEKLC
jgi:tRNA(Ile)-lysidine synthase